MNDFDSIDRAIGARADAAPTGRPDFSEVLASHQSKMRRRGVASAAGVLAIGLAGMAAFAVRGSDAPSVADGPIGSDGTTVASGPTLSDPALTGETVWFCQGALDPLAPMPTTTTVVPETTIAVSVTDSMAPAASTIPDDLPPTEDSGYFRDCVLVQDGNGGTSVTTYVETFPTTTPLGRLPDSFPPSTTTVQAPICTVPDCDGVRSHTVQAGDYPLKIADDYCVSLDDMLAINGWVTGNEFPFPGEVIVIPPPSPDDVGECPDNS